MEERGKPLGEGISDVSARCGLWDLSSELLLSTMPMISMVAPSVMDLSSLIVKKCVKVYLDRVKGFHPF